MNNANNKNKIVAITQPDFFPWMGSFDKFVKSNVFVFLDNVTNRPSDGIWTKRVKIIVSGEAKWLSIPLKKSELQFVPINEMEIDPSSNYIKKHLTTIENNYKKAPYFKEVFPLIEKFYNKTDLKIANRNISFFLDVMKKLEINREYYLSSEMKVEGKHNELLINIVKATKGNSYIYGQGSLSYLDYELWEKNQIELLFQKFNHPTYPQINTKEFIPGLSIIDVLFNIGFKNSKTLFLNSSDGI